MSEEINHEEVIELVKTAQSKKVFDIAAFAKDQATPQDNVVTFLDIESAYRLNKLNEEMGSVTDKATYEAMESEANILAEKIMKSKVVFHMRGVNQDVIEQANIEADKKYPSIMTEFGEERNSVEWMKYWTCFLIAANLVKVVNADGEEDERVFTVEEVMEMRSYFPKEVWDLLVQKMQHLTLANSYFKGLTDAGFLQKS